MAERLPQCHNLKKKVESILQLSEQETSLASCDIYSTQTSLKKAISSKLKTLLAVASNLKEAAAYVRKGSNSLFVEQTEYYCKHSFFQNGKLIIDSLGIDTPVEKNMRLTYEKIKHCDISTVVCVFQSASMLYVTKTKIQLLEFIRNNLGARDRFFFSMSTQKIVRLYITGKYRLTRK